MLKTLNTYFTIVFSLVKIKEMDMGMDSNNYLLLIYISFEESTKNRLKKNTIRTKL